MLLDLAVGQPSHAMLDPSLLNDARLRAADLEEFFYYAPKAGDALLRERLLPILGTGVVGPEATLLTHGVLGGIELVSKTFLGTVTRMVIAEPGYKEAFTIFRRFGMETVALPREGEGLDFAELRHLVSDRRTAVYLVPTLNNPDGWTLGAAERARIAELCVDEGCLLIEDDLYDGLLFDGSRLPSVFQLASARSASHRVVRLSGLAKVLMPGARIGLVEAMPDLVELLLAHKFDFGVSPLLTYVVRQLLEDPAAFVAHRARLSATLSRRMHTLRRALGEQCAAVHWNSPRGGYFIWGKLPAGLDADALLSVAKAHGVGFSPGRVFHVDGGLDTLRVCHAYVEEDQLATAAARLGVALRDALDHPSRVDGASARFH